MFGFGTLELKVYIFFWPFESVYFASVVLLWLLNQETSHVHLYLDQSIITNDYTSWQSYASQKFITVLYFEIKNKFYLEFQHSLVGKQTTNIKLRTRLDRMCSLLLKVMFSVVSLLF